MALTVGGQTQGAASSASTAADRKVAPVSTDGAPATDIVVAHDYLTQRGGAERVALEIARQLQAREVVTSVHAPNQIFPGFDEFLVRESGSRALRAMRGDIRRALPLLAPAWSRMDPVDAEALVCSSSGWSHALRATAGTRKIVYCHNPARWLYQRDDYLQDQTAATRIALNAVSPALRSWDRRAAGTADAYLANSVSVADRIHRIYGIRPEVVHPPLSLDAEGVQDPIEGITPGYFLTVNRPRGYKGTALVVEAFARMPEQRLVIVGMAPSRTLPPNVTARALVSEAELRWLYANARALTSMSHEDFGLTPVEANAFGRPVLVVKRGGFLDSTVEGVTGVFVEEESVDAVIRSVRTFPRDWDAAAIRANADRFSAVAFGNRLREAIAAIR